MSSLPGGGGTGDCKPTEALSKFNQLLDLADMTKELDPCGAALIRWAAYQLANGKCLRCSLEYGKGYTAGYKAGQKEWMTVGEAR